MLRTVIGLLPELTLAGVAAGYEMAISGLAVLGGVNHIELAEGG